MYDELVKRLRTATTLPVMNALCQEAADAIEELSAYKKIALDEHNRAAKKAWEHRWISVEERLPENSRIVLACYDEVILFAFYGAHQWFEESTFSVFFPTHWMPLPELPEPPKEET